ncbi:HSF-type DNA-binding-domain-containing protein [Nemania sp. FL0916]|nr:HSF-type DNA-binding-domain-containing protein [Nemania sp. FL0916]
MTNATDHVPRSMPGRESDDSASARTIPIITTPPTPTPTVKTAAPSPAAGDPMDITTPTNASGAPNAGRDSDGSETNGRGNTASSAESGPGGASNNTMPAPSSVPQPAPAPAPAAAAAAIHQPKIVQTAFIHKLYNMLEDPNIQHLISWSSSAESFVMSPSHDFSKVLAQYFKHTNVSSFVRQLNMYGFHKVSDVFHTGNPETALWEFKHGNGSFKRGDLVGLREIKRRASRHALVHRGDYSNQKPTPPQPGTPAEPMPAMHDGSDPRLAGIEHTLFDISNRLQRSEESAQYMQIKQLAMVDTINRLLHFNQELSKTVLSLVPPDNPVYRDVVTLQSEIHRQTESFLNADEPLDPPISSSRQYFANLDNPPVSPRQLAQDSRPPPHQSRSANFYRPPVPSNLSIGSRRHYGSTSGAPSQSSPSPLRSQAPPPPPGPHPTAVVEPPPNNLARRHTSADIRAHGWQTNPPPPHYLSSGPPSSHWPSSPSRAPIEDHRIREAPSVYSLSRPTTPPAPPFSNGNIGSSLESLNNWSWNSANRENKNLSVRDISTPPTRRGSMAHILNPTDTAERENEDPRGDEDRKRKRIQ